ncbi:MAG: hypothetical protein WBW33_01370 [Bryobacteraceae bacterium]
MSENRRQVLEMLAGGKITADEAERLISALEKEMGNGASATGTAAQTKRNAKYMRVIVEAEDGSDPGPVKVNVRVPLQLLRSGVKLVNLIPAPARQHVNDALREQGIPFDLSQIKPENLEELVDQLNDVTVDVDVDQTNNKVKVRVFCE